MFSFLNNIPLVTRNFLIINVLLYIISMMFLQTGGINLFDLFSSHYVGTPNFQPFQAVTHMFMHSPSDFRHLLFNMLLLLFLGSFLEQRMGHKRFFIFYFLCGIGAFAIENVYYGIEIYNLKNEIVNNGFAMHNIDDLILNMDDYMSPDGHSFGYDANLIPYNTPYGHRYYELASSSGLGASGALFGILGAFLLLFPNTELMLIFIPVPVKAKYLISIYILYELYRMFNPTPLDHVNHLAHLCGAAIGISYVLINRKIDKSNFY